MSVPDLFRNVADDRGDGQPPNGVILNWWFPALDEAISFPITNPSYWISTAASDFVVTPAESRPEGRINWLAEMMRKNEIGRAHV